jgi:hypothetical protein
MGNLDGYDASQYDPDGANFEPIPAADYECVMIESEFKPTKKNDGNEYLQCIWEVIKGEHKGRRLFDRLNLKNSNETAAQIAASTLSAICHAVGVLKPSDSSALHNKPLIVSVIIEERNDKAGVFKNEIKGYRSTKAPAKTETKAEPDGEFGDAKSDAKSDAKPPWKR